MMMMVMLLLFEAVHDHGDDVFCTLFEAVHDDDVVLRYLKPSMIMMMLLYVI